METLTARPALAVRGTIDAANPARSGTPVAPASPHSQGQEHQEAPRLGARNASNDEHSNRRLGLPSRRQYQPTLSLSGFYVAALVRRFEQCLDAERISVSHETLQNNAEGVLSGENVELGHEIELEVRASIAPGDQTMDEVVRRDVVWVKTHELNDGGEPASRLGQIMMGSELAAMVDRVVS